MKKAYRVKSEKDFQKVFNQGQSKANRQFVVYKLPKEGQNHFRVGISVGKKIGNAVTRNQVKRRIRHALMELDKEKQFNQDLDFIIIARKPVSQMDYWEIKKSLVHVLSLSHVILSELS
ncbi:ribonuclease P protein component [Atopostipes suicloacalis DSM 15692]|uniref:Ribonuclease P protein component n=1 Tax=Atopostipes suicloacalis DSM 15692 TaxID=1121025 RepID=A0A1M4X5V6_9LACT|nr:ribonuclease P protein component [Atopostipes suicloacalis]SHE88869.1 ribonuclease P protein component [Atopostipes suicloacalis DSM 15692]